MRRVQIPSWSAPRAMQAFQVMRLGAVFAVGILLTKTKLSTADIGVYEMLLYLGTTLSFFWVSGLLQGIPSAYAKCTDASAQQRFMTQVFWVFNAFALLVSGGLFVFQDALTPALTGLDALPHLGMYCLFLGFNLPSFIVEYVYLMRQQAERMLAWGVVSFGLYVPAVVVPILLGCGLGGGLFWLTVLAVGKWCWALFLVWPGLSQGFDMALSRAYLRFSAPLVLNVLVGNLVLLFDTWLVGFFYHDEAVFALFRYGSRELPLATALATALSAAMIQRLMIDPSGGRAELRQRGVRLMHAVFPLSLVLLFFSKPLFPVVFNPDFAAAAPLFNIYLLLTASRVLLPNALVLASNRSGIILRIGMLELLVKVVLGWLFIQLWGLPGLAWSAVIAFFTEKIGLMIWLESTGVRTQSWLHIRVYALYVVAMSLAYAMSLSF